MTPDSPVQNEDAEVSSLPTAVYPDVPAPPVAAAPMPAPASTPASAPRHPSTHLSDLEASQAPAEVQTSHILPDRAAASHRYVLTAFHARGGMGEVWRCLDSSIGREVALKRLKPSRSGARDRFLHEAQVTGQLEHPSIVPVHDIGFDDNGQPFYVMTLGRGRTLKAAIEEFHAPPEERLKGADDGENSQSKPSAGESRSVR